MNIDTWLESFKAAWLSKNIEHVLSLFSEDVTYYETPFKKVDSYKELEEEWQAIHNQDNMHLDLALFSSENNKHTIIWHLSYATSTNTRRELRGTYLIQLDDQGKCTYFHQTGELKSSD